MKILIVDDDPVIRQLLLQFLRRQHDQVAVAATGAEALQVIRKDPCELLISDWMMPEMDGLELTHSIRNMKLRSYCYVILLTGHEGHRNKMTAMAAGVDAFLPKPFDADEMEMQLLVAERILTHHNHIERLESLVPICCCCKKIQHEDEGWQNLNVYAEAHADSLFHDALCPSCVESRVNPAIIPPSMLDN